MIGNQLTSAFIFLTIAVLLVAGKPPPPPGAPWAKFASKPVFERSLGPPPMSGVSTFSIPYVPKPTMFPKFVDPRIMIAKKTDLLSNLFGGMGPAIGTAGFGSPSPSPSPSTYPGYGSSPYTYPGFMYSPEEMNSDSTAEDTEGNSDLPIFYGPGFGTKTNYFDSTAATNLKRGLYGPMGPKSMFGGAFAPAKTPMSDPFFGASESTDTLAVADGPPFFRRGLLGPKIMPFGSSSTGSTDPLTPKTKKSDFLDAKLKNGETSTEVTEPELKMTTQEPPAYPKIPTIPEETEKDMKKTSLEKIFASSGDTAMSKSSKELSKRMVADDSVPKEYLPGMFGPLGPMGPMFPPGGAFGPSPGIFGPDAFMSKKSMFLDTLFKNLATSTPSSLVTDIPVTDKSTIVPPGFWLPGSMVPDPGAYNAKVETFLGKLFDSLKLNASGSPGASPGQTLTYEESISAGFPAGKTDSARSLPMDYFGAVSPPYSTGGTKSVRSLTDPEGVISAKDQISNSIIGELQMLKDDMISTFNELIIYQKNLTSPAPGTKPFKPFAPPFWSAGAGGATAAADMGILSYKRRMVILGEVFDMLVELQTNVSAAVNEAVKSSYGEESPETEVQITTTSQPDVPILDASVLDTIQAKLTDLNTIGLTKVGPKGLPTKFSRALPASPTSFWVAYPGSDSARRNLNENQDLPRFNDRQDFADENAGEEIEDDFNPGKDSRAIKMQMHQGYQSLPPGTIQSIQAGGGSVPGHEGGGVKLLGEPDYRDYVKSWKDWFANTMKEKEYDNNNRHHHHDRH